MTGTAILPTLVSIVVVLAVLGATLFLLRWASQWRMKSRRRNPKHRVDMVERHPVGRSGAIVVIRHGDTEHVLGVTEHAITPISSSAAPTEPTDEADSTIDLRRSAPPRSLAGTRREPRIRRSRSSSSSRRSRSSPPS